MAERFPLVDGNDTGVWFIVPFRGAVDVGRGGRCVLAFRFRAVPSWARTSLREGVRRTWSRSLECVTPPRAEESGREVVLYSGGRNSTNSRVTIREASRNCRRVMREVVRD